MSARRHVRHRPDKGRNCGTCDFWQPSGDPWTKARGEPGTCHRYAPSMPLGFPATANTDWCGEYEMAHGVADLIEEEMAHD